MCFSGMHIAAETAPNANNLSNEPHYDSVLYEHNLAKDSLEVREFLSLRHYSLYIVHIGPKSYSIRGCCNASTFSVAFVTMNRSLASPIRTRQSRRHKVHVYTKHTTH